MYKFLCCNRSYQKRFDQDLKSNFLIHTSFVSAISINLFYCWKQIFIHTNTWMIGKNSVKFYCLKKKISTVSQIWNILLMQVTDRQKELEGDFEIKHRLNITICVFKAIKYCYLMQIKVFEICALKYMTLTLLVFFCTRISMAISL